MIDRLGACGVPIVEIYLRREKWSSFDRLRWRGYLLHMRQSFSGLYGLTVNVMKEDPRAGGLFVFTNRRHTFT